MSRPVGRLYQPVSFSALKVAIVLVFGFAVLTVAEQFLGWLPLSSGSRWVAGGVLPRTPDTRGCFVRVRKCTAHRAIITISAAVFVAKPGLCYQALQCAFGANRRSVPEGSATLSRAGTCPRETNGCIVSLDASACSMGSVWEQFGERGLSGEAGCLCV